MKNFEEYTTDILNTYSCDVYNAVEILAKFVQSIPKPAFIENIIVSVNFDSNDEGGYKLSIYNMENTAIILEGCKKLNYCKSVFSSAHNTYFGEDEKFSKLEENSKGTDYSFIIKPVLPSNMP